ncbi:MAG TPA: tRNA 2-selenouridine(34) synthase MnmH, partial [Saprospiraceae bacterium]|nr:tRNA 2-selenouridine(34) synthase MnmH [Saprospiraceae bacterium]
MQYISPQYIWQYKQDHTIIDVRSPIEFSSGHIPGAVNVPLFTDDERKIIGTTYIQVSPEKALLKGLDFVGPKMSGFLKQVKQLKSSKLLIHCSRGGKRSESMAWLLGFGGYNISVLEGGYKAYRRYIIDAFINKQLPLIVLGGKTGMNKSRILRELFKLGEQVIDLERLANHKGSAFGRLGEEPQPTVEQFENDLYEQINNLGAHKSIWIENESKSIGSVYIPLGLWHQMKSAPLINIEINADLRLKSLIEDYGNYNKENLKSCFRN